LNDRDTTHDLGDLPAEEFRRLLHEAADWVADYRARIESRRVSPDVEPGSIAASLPVSPPEEAEALDEVMRDFERLIVPGLVHWGHPSFLGYFSTTTNAPGILGDFLAAALNISAMTWQTSPSATELETVVLEWMRQMLGLPREFKGVVYDTASVAVLHALAAAREEAVADARRAGLAGRADVPALTLYASDQAHSSLEKAAITLGLGEGNVRRVASDDEYRMDVKALRVALDEDVRAGRRPLAVVATVGTTSATSVDPVEEIAELCAERGVWLHVDAAYGGAMALLEEGRALMRGVARADSVVFNPHKWLYVPLDFSALYVLRPETLRRVFSLVPEYLRGDAERAGRRAENYMDYGIQLGRRFRALKAWFVIRAFGRRGLAARIRESCRLARLFASWVGADARFELLAPVTMGVVCFRALKGRVEESGPRESESDESTSVESESGESTPVGSEPDESPLNEFNERLLARVNATGEVYLTHTRLRGRLALRVAVGNVLTEERHLAHAWALVRRQLEEM
jgi:aromatic-L-amino-acid decarboxylase